MAYLIQGLFFQEHIGLGVRQAHGGAIAVIESGLRQFMYAGAIWTETPESTEFVGLLQDRFGVSTLSDIYLGHHRFAFIKKYQERSDLIQYNFTVREGIGWVGHWHGPAVGNGISRCVLTEVGDEFFIPGSIYKALGIPADTAKTFSTKKEKLKRKK